ncbi:hypothetical protein Ptr902_00199 [Pyrenophora tritici-repentis]|nr:hypothetical protein Ptr902_00199 [Pyrenophora tritici-repentis]
MTSSKFIASFYYRDTNIIRQREPPSILNLLSDANIKLEGDKPYVKDDDSDKCEEEVNYNSDLEEHFNSLKGEYEDDD